MGPLYDLVDLTITSAKMVQYGTLKQKTSEVIHTTEKHPFLTVEKGFLPVRQLHVGMHVVGLEKGNGRITQLKVIPGTMVMYNLEVVQDHNFAVGQGQWIVHNCDETPSDTLNRLKSQLSIRQKDGAIKGLNGRTTKSISELYNIKGNQVGGRGISDWPIDDPILGQVQCSEGNCLISARGQLQRGSTYNLYTAQKDGKIPCATCQENLQKVADSDGVTLNAYSIGKNGDIGRPLTFRPQSDTVSPDVVWDEDIPLFDL